MKHITRDTMNVLMGNNRKKNLMKLGYTIDDVKDGLSLYKALFEIDDFMVNAYSNLKLNDIASEIWSVAQLLPGEGIEDGMNRIVKILNDNIVPSVIDKDNKND